MRILPLGLALLLLAARATADAPATLEPRPDEIPLAKLRDQVRSEIAGAHGTASYTRNDAGEGIFVVDWWTLDRDQGKLYWKQREFRDAKLGKKLDSGRTQEGLVPPDVDPQTHEVKLRFSAATAATAAAEQLNLNEYQLHSSRLWFDADANPYYVLDFVRYDWTLRKNLFSKRVLVSADSGSLVSALHEPALFERVNATLPEIPAGFDPVTRESSSTNWQTVLLSPFFLGSLVISFVFALLASRHCRRSKLKSARLDVAFAGMAAAQVLMAAYIYRIGDVVNAVVIGSTVAGTLQSWVFARVFLKTAAFDDKIEETGPKDKIEKSVSSSGKWGDLVLQDRVVGELRRLVAMIEEPEKLKRYGIKPPKGILLYGPPGTGKTTIARVIAGEAKASFMTLNASDIYSKWLGESEQNIKKFFAEARRHKSVIIFLDEIDALFGSRGVAMDSAGQYIDKLTSAMLAEIDGIQESGGIFLVGATNRPDIIDPAMLRAGRLSFHIEIPAPGEAERKKLFQIFLRGFPLASDVSIDGLARSTADQTGADIRDLCDGARLVAFEAGAQELCRSHFDAVRENHERFRVAKRSRIGFLQQKAS